MHVGVWLTCKVHNVRDPEVAHLLEHHLTASHKAATQESVKIAAEQVDCLHLVIFLHDFIRAYFQRLAHNDLFAHHFEVLVEQDKDVVDSLEE